MDTALLLILSFLLFTCNEATASSQKSLVPSFQRFKRSSSTNQMLNTTEAICQNLALSQAAITIGLDCATAVSVYESSAVGSSEERGAVDALCATECARRLFKFFLNECKNTMVAESFTALCSQATGGGSCYYAKDLYNWTAVREHCEVPLSGQWECSESCRVVATRAVEVVGCCLHHGRFMVQEHNWTMLVSACELAEPEQCPNPFQESKDVSMQLNPATSSPRPPYSTPQEPGPSVVQLSLFPSPTTEWSSHSTVHLNHSTEQSAASSWQLSSSPRSLPHQPTASTAGPTYLPSGPSSVQSDISMQPKPSQIQVRPSHMQVSPSRLQASPSHMQASLSLDQPSPSSVQGDISMQPKPSQIQVRPSHMQASPSHLQASPSHMQASLSLDQLSPSLQESNLPHVQPSSSLVQPTTLPIHFTPSTMQIVPPQTQSSFSTLQSHLTHLQPSPSVNQPSPPEQPVPSSALYSATISVKRVLAHLLFPICVFLCL